MRFESPDKLLVLAAIVVLTLLLTTALRTNLTHQHRIGAEWFALSHR